MAKKEDTKIITPSEQERVRLLSRTPGVEPTVDMTTEISGVKYREIGPGVELELRGRPHFIYSGTFFIDPKVAREFTTGPIFASGDVLADFVEETFKDRIKDGWQGLSRRRTLYTWNENDPELRKRAGPLPAGSYVRPEVANLERVIFYER